MATQTNGIDRTIDVTPPKPAALARTHEQTLAARTDRHALEPATFQETMQVAQVIAQSGIVPSSLRKPEAIVAAVMLGRDLGLSTMQSIRGIHVIEGKPTLAADTIVGVCKRSPLCEYFQLVDSTPEVATYETKRRGEPHPTKMSFTIKEAATAGLTNKNTWKSYPAAMLRARAATALARAVYPDLVSGLYDPDELERPEPVEVNPRPTARPTPAARPVAKSVASVTVEPPSAEMPTLTPSELAAFISEATSGAGLAEAVRTLTAARLTDTVDASAFGSLYAMALERCEAKADWDAVGSMVVALIQAGKVDDGERTALKSLLKQIRDEKNAAKAAQPAPEAE